VVRRADKIEICMQELPAFLNEKLPVWDRDDPHGRYITYFKHDASLVRASEAACAWQRMAVGSARHMPAMLPSVARIGMGA
jgi:hypothetical protein